LSSSTHLVLILHHKMSNGVVSTSHSEDLAFSRALHGNQVKEGFLSNLASKNRKVHDSATGDYLSLWKKPENETEEDEKKRLNQYTQLTNTYYNLATDFYEV
jgi:sterol 24-C-methyltransferase